MIPEQPTMRDTLMIEGHDTTRGNRGYLKTLKLLSANEYQLGVREADS